MQCKIITDLYNTINNIKLRQKEPTVLKGFDSLNKADIKFIDTISLNPNQNAATLATILNVSRGAITQIVNRLEQMDIVKRVPVKGNRKEKIIQLTSLGKEIKKAKDKNHHDANKQMCSFLRGLQANQLEAIMMFLNKINTLDISLFDCLGHDCALESKGE